MVAVGHRHVWCVHEHSDDEDIFVMSHEAAAHKYSDSTKIEVKSFLTMVQSAHELGVAPEPLGIVSKTREDRGVINVGGYGMGDKGAKLLASGAASVPSIKFLSLRENRLTSVGTCAVLSVVQPYALQTLDLSHNNIGEASLRLLSKAVLVRCLA